jgi:hypothetical protein
MMQTQYVQDTESAVENQQPCSTPGSHVQYTITAHRGTGTCAVEKGPTMPVQDRLQSPIERTMEDDPNSPAAYPTYSTYWMPLDAPRADWAAFGEEATRIPMLTATAHAFFALAHETKALKHFTSAGQQRHSYRLPTEADFWYRQTERTLYDATHNWSRAACALDSLLPSELAPQELTLVRTMSRAARQQQERLWRLTDEVRAEIAAFRAEQQHPPQQQPMPIPCLDQHPSQQRQHEEERAQ